MPGSLGESTAARGVHQDAAEAIMTRKSPFAVLLTLPLVLLCAACDDDIDDDGDVDGEDCRTECTESQASCTLDCDDADDACRLACDADEDDCTTECD